MGAELDTATFQRLRRMIYELSGIHLGEKKEALVAARVRKRMRELRIDDYRRYCEAVEDDSTGRERMELLNRISTNVTEFFRERRHFDFLAGVLGKWEAEGRLRYRLWSAACSSGEEAYSMAIVLRDTLRNCWDAKILATDISTSVIASARLGQYGRRQVENVPQAVLTRHFRRIGAGKEDVFEVSEDVKTMVHFGRLNLSRPPFPLNGPFDVVFCRNVMIYFDNPVRKRLLDEIRRLLRPGGYLMVGHAESLVGMLSDLRKVGPAVYQKDPDQQ